MKVARIKRDTIDVIVHVCPVTLKDTFPLSFVGRSMRVHTCTLRSTPNRARHYSVTRRYPDIADNYQAD